MQKSTSLTYGPSSELLPITAKQLLLNRERTALGSFHSAAVLNIEGVDWSVHAYSIVQSDSLLSTSLLTDSLLSN